MRFGMATLVAALAFATISVPAPSLAQDAAPPAADTPASNAPATDAIGPRELQNFSLNGTVTRPAPAVPARTTPTRDATRPAPANATPRTTPRERPAPVRSQPATGQSVTGQSVTASLPPASALTSAPELQSAQPGLEPTPAPIANFTPGQPTNFLPWLLALVLLGAGAGYFVWRKRSQPSYATAGVANSFVAAELAPDRPQLPRSPPPRAVPPPPQAPSGIVSTRLRPWLEIAFSPSRCDVEEDKATIQFDIEVFNSGAAPARDVLIEASMFNAGPEQDQEIGAFFAHPVAKGNRIPAIPPLKRVALKSAVSLTREQMRQFEIAGRRLFVPLIGFNALYSWSGGDGQTSASYLVGRDTKSEKMAPLRLDLGPRAFRRLEARQHNVGVRR